MREQGRKRKRKKVIIISAVAAAVMLSAYAVLVNVLVSAALVPSFMEKLEAFQRITEESYAAQVQSCDIEMNRTKALEETEEWLKTAERRKISRVTEDGYKLIAEEFPAKKNGDDSKVSHRWVLLLHGYTGWKEEMYPFGRWYHQEGFHILAPDLRCQGESEGDFIGMGWTDHYDCMLWIDYILSQDPEAEEDLPENVCAVISDCAYTDAYSMFGEKIKEWFHLPAVPLVDSVCLALKIRGGYNLKDASALEAVKKSSVPTLFIHGDEDAMISVHMAEKLYEAAACQKELLIVKGAGHGQTQDKVPYTYYGKIKDFLEKNLAKSR